MKRYRDVFFNELNLQRVDDKDEGYNNIYESLAGGDRYTPSPGLLHDTVQYEDESQKPSYKDKSEESSADKKQHLIKENVMKDFLHNFNDSNIIVLHPAAINTHYTGETKKGLRHSE